MSKRLPPDEDHGLPTATAPTPEGGPLTAGEPDSLSRRDFLKVGAAAAATLLAGCGADGAAPPGGGGDGGDELDAGVRPPRDMAEAPPDLTRPIIPPEGTPESSAFPLGVASGDASDTSAVVWARYDGAAPLVLIAWRMEGARYAAEHDPIEARPVEGGFVHVTLAGLVPGARYRYAFFEATVPGAPRAARSPVGRFRAALAADSLEPITIGAVSCTSNDRRFETLERAGERVDLDAFLLLGDTTYNDGAKSLADYRRKWAQNLSTPGYRAVRAATSVYATWDDHEVDNNWNPESIGADQFAAARRTYFENLPLGRDQSFPDRLWRRFTWGKTADFFVLDSRGERLPSTRRTAQAIYLSRPQMDWLKAGLKASTCAFKVILNSVPIGDFGLAFEFGAADRWTGYDAQRNEILDHIDGGGIKGVLWVSGDFHLASMGRVTASGRGSKQIEILAGPGAQAGNPLQLGLGLVRNIDWSSQTNNYTVLRLDPQTGDARISYFDAKGALLVERVYRP